MWITVKRRDRGDEPRKSRQLDKQRHKQRRKSPSDVGDPADAVYTQRNLVSSTGKRSETEGGGDFSGEEHSLADLEELTSSSSADSIASTSSDDLPSKLREFAARVKREDDRNLLRKVEQHIHDKDREMRKAVTTIAKMHKADTQKRDDRYFIKSTKTLRVLVENWSKTQKTVGPSFNADAKANLIRIINASSPSTDVETFRPVGTQYTQRLATAGDIPRLMQVYIWVFLNREVFGRFRWASHPDKFIDLDAAVSPRDSSTNIRVEQYHEWRAMTARLAYQNMPKERLSATSGRIGCLAMEPFRPYSAANINDANVVVIVQRALELDIEMSKQKAPFYLSYLGCSPQYDHKEMDMIQDRDDENATTNGSWDVDLFVAPALFKSGTAEGENYEVKSILMATEVLCSPHQTHRAVPPHQKYRTPPQHNHRVPSPYPVRRAITMPVATTVPTAARPIEYQRGVIYAEPLPGPYQRN